MSAAIPRPSAVIVGEPTRHRVVHGHKSYTELETQIVGHAVHSSRSDLGASAVAAAARLITWLDDIDRANAAAMSARRGAFEPNYTTLHCGLVAGGTAATAVADHATFSTDIRAVPWEDPRDYVRRFRTYADAMEQDLLRRHPAGGIGITVVTDIPGLSPEVGGSAESLALRLSPSAELGTVSYGTEAGLFQKAGWSTVVCGPGDILQAHRADEFIEISQLAAGTEFMARLRDTLIG
jgi:acetylornithine deacetylase